MISAAVRLFSLTNWRDHSNCRFRRKRVIGYDGMQEPRVWAKIDSKRKGKGLPSWEDGHWFWVLILGFMLAACSLIYISTLGNDINSKYQSPKIENGNIIPGHYK